MAEKVTNLQILKRAVKKSGYSYGLVDPSYSEAIYVTNGRKYFISRSKTSYGMYPTNYKFAEHLVDNKAATKRVLKKFGFRIIKGKQFYIKSPSSDTVVKKSDNTVAARTYAKRITYPVFVKPNRGSRGADARIVFSETGLRAHIKQMRANGVVSFLVEKFTQRPEYRIFVVGGEVQFMYRKKRVSITGTGEHTIAELIAALTNPPDTKLLKHMLRTHKKTKSSVLKHEYEMILQDTGNISLGAEIVNYRDQVPRAIHSWARRLHEVTGLDVFGVDVFTKGDWKDPEKYLIIEVNSSPALSGIYNTGHAQKVYDVWHKIMKRYFNGKR